MHINSKTVIVVFLFLIAVSAVQAEDFIDPGVNFLKSAILPGWGQLSLEKNYGYGYLFAEASFWSMRLYYLQESDNNATASYNYARKYAGVDPEGHFSNQFYEDMRNYSSSDAYNNLVVVKEALKYSDNPEEQLAYIAEHEYKEDHYWSWYSDERQSHYSGYRNNIDHYKDYLKLVGGVIAANHIIGAIDALRLSNYLKQVRFGVDQNSDHATLLTCTIKFK
ncbi:MAG: hypothetical protein K9M99_00320 [Candidatus Cloacimonetes bacterium]|nr:hypothetical protein [Candidatus Cloacimonadota bacterium]